MPEFEFAKLDLEDAYVIRAVHMEDYRGSFTKYFEKGIFEENGISFHTHESFVSVSAKNAIRGLHFQLKNPQAKIVHVLRGKAWDVIVDLRPASPTYGKWTGVNLTSENHNLLYIPKGYAHGFAALEDETMMLYFCEGAYDKETDTGIVYNDASIGIEWPLGEREPILSERDRNLMTFEEYQKCPMQL